VDWAAPILESPVKVKDSNVIVPSTPGAGMKWDEKAVRKYAA
jgi:mandelate racemase